MRKTINIFFLACCLLFAACEQETKKVTSIPAEPKIPAVMPPFVFHKLLEVAPGNEFDILSWGRGAKQKSAFLILHSDSARQEFTTTTGDLDAGIVDVFNTDMDVDGNPEIIIQEKGKDSTNYLNVYAFEFNGSKANKLEFPKLTKEQRKGYRGGDQFYITDGQLLRKFPVYDESLSPAKTTGQERVLQYGLHNNSFTVKQISKDSTLKSVDRPVKTEKADKPAAEKPAEKKPEKHKKAEHHTKKRHEPEHKKKKKKHHRRSEE